MDAIVNIFDSMGLDFWQCAKIAGILLLGIFLISMFGRFIFGRKSALSNAISSAIGILFIYAVTVILKGAGVQFEAWLAPLPLADIRSDALHIFSFEGADYTVICAELLSTVILAFLVNIVDGWLPKGKNIFTWVFFRGLTVFLAMALHLVVTGLFTKFLPEGIVTYAPTILLALLVLLMLTGALKLLVGVLLSTVNPLIGALYTFFFANVVGKQITKAVLTSALLCALVAALNYVGCTVISIAAPALSAYIPFVIVLVLLWYLVNRIF